MTSCLRLAEDAATALLRVAVTPSRVVYLMKRAKPFVLASFYSDQQSKSVDGKEHHED
jgi:hypothetical protein